MVQTIDFMASSFFLLPSAIIILSWGDIVIVTDQASIHRGNAIFEKFEERQECPITIFELPTYSPHLNLIKILWRFIKYEWIPIDADKDWDTFVESIKKNLLQFIIIPNKNETR